MPTTTTTPNNPPAVVRTPVGGALVYGLFGAPLAWLVQLLLNYIFAAHACFPTNIPLARPIWSNVWWLLLAIDLVAIAVGITSLLAALGQRTLWRARALETIADKRNHYLAHWSVLTSALFSIVIVFTIIMLFIEPVCDV
ncbi:MAG TPA: hypothetical protein VFG73_06795 [Rhodanobacteraceae bacterium]|nr:hypothetical protein [Rhodanobacteraceae bacterium]